MVILIFGIQIYLMKKDLVKIQTNMKKEDIYYEMELWENTWKKKTCLNQNSRIMKIIFMTILWKENILQIKQ